MSQTSPRGDSPQPATGESRLRRSIRRLHSKANAAPNPKGGSDFRLEPSNPFEVAVAEQIRGIRQDVDELKDRLNWLFGLIIAAAAANVILALLG